MKNILIINRDGDIAEKIRHGLMDESIAVYCVSTMHEAIQHFIKTEFCLLILDAQISAADNHKLLSAMVRARATPIFVLSEQFRHSERLEIFRAGAHAYIGKPYSLEECLAQAKSLIRLYYDLKSAKSHDHTLVYEKKLLIDPQRRQVLLDGQELQLTRKEFNLLFYLASNPEQVFSREKLYDRIWDEHSAYNVDEVVKAQIKSLRQKLSITGKEYIQNVWGVGYRFHIEPDDK